MFNTIRAEYRKFLTVRSTYAILGIAVLLLILFGFYVEGYRISSTELYDKSLFYNQSQQGILLVGFLGSLIGLLLMTHEYRYNTIMYTLTAARSRTRVFLAKTIVITVFAVVFSILVGFLTPLLVWLGVRVHGGTLIPQHIAFVQIIWHDVFVAWAYCMFGFILAVIVRSQVGAISALFLVPAVLEPLLGLILKKKAIYLPYNSTQSIVTTNASLAHISAGRATLVVLAYIVVGLFVGWFLFLKRDASS